RLKDKNIVPFLGVDSTTFPGPARAMVSPWMPLGSALKYMGENSPVAPYAIDLVRFPAREELSCAHDEQLHDVSEGMNYLHSRNVVHGDLCGRNILIHRDGHACLTDFGLAAFVESDTSIQASARSGSTHWMAPELLLQAPGAHFKRTPVSDIWAFGCMCCEIWSEGDAPFSHVGSDSGVIFSFSNSSETAPQAMPYPSQPHDKAGTQMPDGLWELVLWCWNRGPADRPAAPVIADRFPTWHQMRYQPLGGFKMNQLWKRPLPVDRELAALRVNPPRRATFPLYQNEKKRRAARPFRGIHSRLQTTRPR
ncbi:kinase-like domain-containing protein, partial [Mycena latifolia]